MGAGASVPERLTRDDAKQLVGGDGALWLDAWDDRFVAEPKTVSKAAALRVWAKAERGSKALGGISAFKKSVATAVGAYDAARPLVAGAAAVDEALRLEPADHSETLSSLRRARMRGTREWLVADVEAWLADGAAPKLGWLRGAAGTGKSVALAMVLDRCAQRGRAAAWHFCRHDDAAGSTPRRIVETLAAQLCARVPGFGKRLKALRRDRG
mmetsp:Transcript_8519/g.29115  ORF Transcript_8519/g.29115 Transcript_8519/m.29115 type:complete len:212 (+) Transcript_8519:57-692(+)